MTFDRGKFKGAKLSANKDSQKSAQENNKSFGGGNNSRAGFLTIEDGKNVFRILPPHPEDTIGAAYLPKRVAMLKCEVPVWKDGEQTDQTEIKNKNIFIGTQHGGLPKDPIELYIEYVRKRASDEIQDKEEKQKFLSPITGWRGKDGKWNWGISPKTSFVAYAIKDGVLGRLELYESMVKDMDRLAISEAAEDVMEVDPFSDPNEGCELIITKQKETDKQGKETNKWEYIVTKGEPSRQKRESWDDYFERTAVSDAHLEELIKQEPLSKIQGKDVYTKRDWNFALDGLLRFDQENKYGIFDNDDFLEELQEIEKLVPEPPSGGDDIEQAFPDKKKDSTTKQPQNEETERAQVEEPETTHIDMKFALKKFIKKQYGEQYVDQIPTDKTQLEKWYCLYEDAEELPIKLKNETAEKEDKPVENKKETVSQEGAINEYQLSDQVKLLRERRRAAAGK